MEEHPIEGLMITAMNSIKDMIDVDTIIGDPIETKNNTVIIPISKVSFGFASGGSEFKGEVIEEYTKKNKEEEVSYRNPFGGGSGAGVSINPVAFIVVQGECVKLLPVNHTSAIDKLLDYIPDLFDKLGSLINKNSEKEETNTNKVQATIKTKPKRNNPKTTISYEFDYNDSKPNTHIDENNFGDEN